MKDLFILNEAIVTAGDSRIGVDMPKGLNGSEFKKDASSHIFCQSVFGKIEKYGHCRRCDSVKNEAEEVIAEAEGNIKHNCNSPELECLKQDKESSLPAA